MMIDLVPLDGYRQGIEATSSKRLGLLSGLAFAVLFVPGLALASIWASPEKPVPWLLLVLASAIAGILFGVRFPRLLKHKLLRTTESVYFGRPPYVTTPPDSRFNYRLPANLRVGRIAVGGVLYVAPGLATFVPHRINLPQHRAPVVVSDGSGCVLHQLPSPKTLLGDVTSGAIQATSPLGSWTLYVPPTDVLPPLQALLEAPSGGHA